jgi:rubrerythrin
MMQIEKALGQNRTGAATAKKLTEEMVAGTQEFLPTSAGDEREIANVRAEVASESGPIGSIPPPATLKQAVSTAAKAVMREKPTLFLDLLGARIAFERTGVRLYEALLSKYDIFGSFPGGPTREDLQAIRRDELEHFHLLTAAMLKLGGDPTAMTPAADIQAVLSSGVPKVAVDPRVSLADSLECALTAELVDNDSWESLIAVARRAGEEELAGRFTQALAQEAVHLEKVRAWLLAYRSA